MIVIAGPTASGKSAAALALAQAHDGVVVNADASQVYRDLRVLTARPTAAEEAQAPHRLFGFVDAATACSAVDWAAHAAWVVHDVASHGKLPILVGGTGLYLRTLLDGIAPVPPIEPAIRAAVRALPVAQAHAALAHEDPPAATRLHAADTTRVARALEVVRSTGRPLAHWQAERQGGVGHLYDLFGCVLDPDRAELAARIDSRAAAMLDGGAIEEVAALLARALSPDLPAMRAIGVASIAALLAGDLTRDEALARLSLDTRRYAKRQATWFRHQVPPGWPRIATPHAALQQLGTKLRESGLT